MIGDAAKWYIEIDKESYSDYASLAHAFLNNFQLPTWKYLGIDILSTFKQDTSTHISNHIHEWRRPKRLVRNKIHDDFIKDWFTLSFLPPIAKDVTMVRVVDGSHQ